MRQTFSRNIVVGLISVAAIYVVARASGVPTSNPLVYRGVLEDGGKPVNGSRDIQLRAWNDATSTAAGNLKCNFIPTGPTTIENGRFELALPSECVQAVKDNADLWIEILVDNSSLGRSPVGAVPYAMETGRPSYVNPVTGGRVTLGGYCGATPATAGSITGGYAGAKTMCESACGSPTAHVCKADEIGRFVETGGTIPANTRYQSFVYSYNGTASTNDCNGWTSTNGLSLGWNSTAGAPSTDSCSSSYPLACCD